MNETVLLLNTVLATGGLLLLLGAAFLFFDLYTQQVLKSIVRQYALLTAFILSSAGIVMSLIYSEVFGFIPCGLCWLGRIFLYPQAFLTATALMVKDRTVALYGIVLSVPGLLTGLYQHYLQLGGSNVLGCPTAGPGADCAKRIMFEYGFVTFPMLSVIMFVFLIALYWYYWQVTKE